MDKVESAKGSTSKELKFLSSNRFNDLGSNLLGILFKSNDLKDRKLVNPAISAAVAAWARVHMHQFLNMPENPIIYKDTDSLVLQYPLSGELIGPLIGQLKLEYEITEAIFLKPKTYALKTSDNKVIIKAAGIPNDTLSYEDFNTVLNQPNSFIVVKTIKLVKSLANLSISQKEYSFSRRRPIGGVLPTLCREWTGL